jgi:MFS family permease
MLAWCTLALGLTAPGQTIGVSVFVDEFIDGLGVSRSSVSAAYLVGTLLAAVALPLIGRRIDVVGVSRSMTLIGAAFGAALIFVGGVQGIVTLAIAFIGIRLFGQGALSLVGQTGIALWFDRRRGFAIGTSMLISGALMALSPLVFSVLISGFGWRWAWVILGVAILVTIVPIGHFLMIDRPSAIGQLPDGSVPSAEIEVPVAQRSFTAAEAIRTPAYWTVAATVAMSASLVTGVTFHHLSIMEAQGLNRTEAAAVFLPQVIGVSAAGFIFGWLTDKVSARLLLPVTGATLGAAMLLATTVSPGALALLYGFVLGVNLGQVQAISTAIYPKWFGVAHIGAIRGIATSIMVGASATGPLLISAGNDLFDSYEPVLLLTGAAAFVVAAMTAIVPPPKASTGPTEVIESHAG